MRTLLIAALASLAGCAAGATPEMPMAADPADPALGLSARSYNGVVNYRHRDPVDPKNWRRLNDDLAPAGQGSGT